MTFSFIRKTVALMALTTLALTATAKPKQTPSDEVRDAMRRATEFMMEKVSYNGGFVWNYMPDFSRQWGEMEAKRTMVWIQPPGTPSVGHLLLDAYHCTGDEYYYDVSVSSSADPGSIMRRFAISFDGHSAYLYNHKTDAFERF